MTNINIKTSGDWLNNKVRDKRFVVWAKCQCNSAFDVFRGGPRYKTAMNCKVKLPNTLSTQKSTEWQTVDAVIYNEDTSKLAAFIINPETSSDKRKRLEAMVGWKTPCLGIDFSEVPDRLTYRFRSIPLRMCFACTNKAIHKRRWYYARIAFMRWKMNCRFIYK